MKIRWKRKKKKRDFHSHISFQLTKHGLIAYLETTWALVEPENLGGGRYKKFMDNKYR